MSNLRYAYQQDGCSADGINCVYPAVLPLLFRILFKNPAAYIAMIDQQQNVAEEKHKEVADQHHMPSCAARASPESTGNSITCQKDGAGEKHQKHVFFLFTFNLPAQVHTEKCKQAEYTAPEEKGDVDGLAVGHGDPFDIYAHYTIFNPSKY